MFRHTMSRIQRYFYAVALFLVLPVWGDAQLPPPPPAVPVALDAAQLFAYDKNLPLLASEQAGQPGSGYSTTNVTYYSTNNQTVPGVLVLPSGHEGEKLACVILMHGLGQNKLGLMPIWPSLIKAGYAIFSIDAQYHGDRKSKAPLDLFAQSPYSTRDMLIQTVADLRRAVDYLQSRKEIDPNRIGYAGFSMGGILGTIVAAVDDRVKAPILALAGGDWKLMRESKLPNLVKARREHPELADIGFTPMDPVDPIHWVARISPRPILFINGDKDDIVPVPAAKALQDAAGQPKEVFPYHGGHVPPLTEFPRVIDKMVSWLNQNLKGAAASAGR